MRGGFKETTDLDHRVEKDPLSYFGSSGMHGYLIHPPNIRDEKYLDLER